MHKKKILIAMSGGVDSSVAAKILKDQGHDVAGIFLHFWKEEFQGKILENKCCSTESLKDAREVAQKLDIPFYTLNFSEVFKKKIVDYFLEEYRCGRTPNPCVKCNKTVKLGKLIKEAKKFGFDCVASGHYAKVKEKNGVFRLYRGKDATKDQSYFLHQLSQEDLKNLIFPLADYTKEEVRKIAKKSGFKVAEKKDSTEVCFISGKDHNKFLKRNLSLKPGPIKILNSKSRNEERIIGMHSGLPLYTIGQRKGIEIGGTGPYYVAKKNHETNTLFVVKKYERSSLYKNSFCIKNISWISGKEPEFPFSCQTVIRYQHSPVSSIISKKGKNILEVKTKESLRAITPGQSAVFYRKNEVIGGGIIEK